MKNSQLNERIDFTPKRLEAIESAIYATQEILDEMKGPHATVFGREFYQITVEQMIECQKVLEAMRQKDLVVHNTCEDVHEYLTMLEAENHE